MNGGPAGTSSDPYVDPTTGVLRNQLAISDSGELEAAEADFSAARLAGLQLQRLPGDALHSADASVGLGIHLVGVDPDELLTPAVGAFYAPVLTLERILVSRLRDQVGEASEDEMDAEAEYGRAADS